ncbi:hypothetical protein ACOME3_001559 [Neoechinorhynchus agilis]
MGRRYIRQLSTAKIYLCSTCSTPLAKHRDVICHDFRGETGEAYFIKRIYNSVTGSMEKMVMMTGAFLIRAVYCTICKEKVGWKYEYAEQIDQQYKEGRSVLEALHVEEYVQKVIRCDPESDSDSDGYHKPRPRY